MKNISEEQLLHELDIPDWRHMSKDKILTFASQMCYLDPDVAKSAINQFPNFKDFGCDLSTCLRDSLTKVCDSADKGMDKAIAVNERILDSLDKELNKPFMTQKRHDKIIDSMLQVSQNIADLQKEHHNFLLTGFRNVAAFCGGAIVIAGAILGVNIKKN